MATGLINAALMILLALRADAQLTVDDAGSCESSTSTDELINVIREELRGVRSDCTSTQRNIAVDTSSLCQ